MGACVSISNITRIFLNEGVIKTYPSAQLAVVLTIAAHHQK